MCILEYTTIPIHICIHTPVCKHLEMQISKYIDVLKHKDVGI